MHPPSMLPETQEDFPCLCDFVAEASRFSEKVIYQMVSSCCGFE